MGRALVFLAGALLAAGCAGRVAPPAPSSPVVDGRCGGEPGMCLLGTPAPSGEPGAEFGWRCLGVNGGASASCSVDLSAAAREEVAVEPPPRAEAVPRPAAQVAPPAGPASETAAAGQTQVARGGQRIADLLAAKSRRTPAQRKVGSRLLERAAAAAARERPDERVRGGGTFGVGGPPDTQAEDGRVLVDIRAEVTPAVLARIRELGGTLVNSVPRYRAIRALLPLPSVERLAALAAIRTIRTADEAVTRKDDTSEGDAAHRASTARTTHGVDGTGVGIGVLSNGVRTLADRPASGDLPAQVTVLPGQEGVGDEGTAMLEIVHDLAPGADLYFATASNGQAQFGANIEALCEAGADVIVDDVGYFREANLQDNVIIEGIDAAVADGCFFFSAAGNDGNLNDGTSSVWEGDYAAGSALVVDGETVGGRHDFGGGREENPVSGSYAGTVVLQWADPLGASSNDYDLFLVDANGNVFASSTDTQDGTQDPIESISTGFFAYANARLVVVKASGADRYLRLQAFGGELELATAGNTFGHPGAENAFGVGQVEVRTAGGTGGVFDGTESVRTSSSDGPRRVFFEADGTASTASDFSSTGGKLLQKPDLVAAGCVSTATPGLSTFCGTSAAAPHAAAIAALMLEAAGGPARVSLSQLRTALAGAALDIEAKGVDRDSGAGIAMAPGAVDAVDVAAADRNRAPTVVGGQDDRTLASGSAAVTFDLAATFADPDRDTLSYDAVSSDSDRLTVTRNRSQVTLTPGSPGRAVVTLRATDPDGLSAVETFKVTVTAGTRDYDGDDDGLIDVGTLAQLDAVRYDLDGDGLVDGATWMPYYAAFPMGALEMGCPDDDGCTGYELTADLDFDTDGSGSAAAGDTYWNAGAGWVPIGDEDAPYTADFTGNDHTVANLFIDRDTEDEVGLFGAVGGGRNESYIRGVGLVGAEVTGRHGVGSLLGRGVYTLVRNTYATGSVSGRDEVGGLVGRTWAGVRYSYAAVDVSGDELVGGLVGHQILNDIVATYATGNVSGNDAVGGLVGAASDRSQTILASYATGDVSGRGARLTESDAGLIICDYLDRIGPVEPTSSTGGGVGGLVGSSCAHIEASYATGAVSGTAAVGGLAGTASFLGARSSYWDLETSGVRVGVGEYDTNDNGVMDGSERHLLGVAGMTTAELQGPTDYTGIYETWNIDLQRSPFSDGEADDPWNFGSSTQYPVLSVDVDDITGATWKEFGYQLRAGPTLAATTTDGQAQVALTWTAIDVGGWSPAPSVTYTVYRDNDSSVETVADALAGLAYTDTGVTVGTRYRYRVAAVVDGGERVRSPWVPVTAGRANQGPVPVGVLADRMLEVGASAIEVDVAWAFRDPDSDTLTYAASSSLTSVAAVSRTGSLVTITAGSAGVTVVTVTATDAGGSAASATQRFTVRVGYDYDADGDELIEIETLAQLDAVRLDLNGNGRVDRSDNAAAYTRAFPSPFARLGCGVDGCSGYELEADLDFDTDGNGRADAGDEYWNDGTGWEPIGLPYGQFLGILLGAFRTTFEGNGHTLSNLFIDGGDYSGLFGGIRSSGVVRNVVLIDVDVTGEDLVGGLAGRNDGVVSGGQTAGRVSGEVQVGGLAGANLGTIILARSSAAVAGMAPWGFRGFLESDQATGGLVGYNGGTVRSSYAAGRVVGGRHVGGLVGFNFNDGWFVSSNSDRDHARIVGSYATGSVAGTSRVGGLVGLNGDSGNAPFVLGEIHSSYATGRVSSGGRSVGGLVGYNSGSPNGVITASYWDSSTSGHTTGTGARTTAQLQSLTGYSGIYGSWKVDVDGDGTNDDPWHFGTGSQSPALKANVDGQGTASWEEFGHQLRAGPTLTATASTTMTPGRAQVALTWTAVVASHWNPAADVTYTVTRAVGGVVEILRENVGELLYTDPAARTGAEITYQVAAVVDGGESVRSAVVEVNTPGNSPPLPVGTLPDRWLHVGDTASVEFGEAFEDPEDDALTYTAASSATGVTTPSVSGTRVSITPVAAGTATITVTATDPGGSMSSAAQTFTVTVVPTSATDFDADDDGLIEITTLARLDAVRYDLDADGAPTADGATAYAAAFTTVGDRQACGGPDGCVGYELEADLDFDTNGNGSADAGDTYWNGGAGWEPIDAVATPGVVVFGGGFRAIFEGNGHTIANLFIDRGSSVGLFGITSYASVIRHVGLIDVDVAGSRDVGGLAGTANGSVIGSYVTGTVSGTGDDVGGLVGANWGSPVVASYAAVTVTGRTNVGGLIGQNRAALTASYATGRVAGERYVGGLVGVSEGAITASYATGPVSGDSDVGGLVGRNRSTVTASYWDTTTSRRTSGSGGQGRTTAQLQAPTGDTGIYAQWNVDVAGDSTGDSLWHFGTGAQYPVLAVDVDGAGGATWQEFGYQLRGGPTLTATGTLGRNEVALSWTAAVASFWTPAPGVTYTVTRDDGTAVAVVAEGLSGTSTTDTGVTSGRTFTYQVTAVAAGGAATHSAPKNVAVVGNRPPMAVGTLANRTLPVADGAVDVEVANAFSDLDNDALTFGAMSSATTVATVVAPGGRSPVIVTPRSGGMATITVTATDVGGSNTAAIQRFVVTVPNRPPVTDGSLPPLLLRVADGATPVEVSGAFRDPDGDTLTYDASSADDSVATATASGSTVTVVPVSGGTVTVTVTATDRSGSNTAATQTFAVTVANRSPEAVGRLDALSLRVADGEKTVRVSGAFRDPDGDALTYGASSSDESVATAVATGGSSTVTVTPLSAGTATVTVTATDRSGSNTAATQTFAVTVANRSPEAVGRLDAVSLRVADGATPVEVSGAFRDPDGDTLTYDALSSDESVATASASGSTVTVVPVSGGTATVTVTATDVDGSNTAAIQTFRVTVANRSPEADGSLPPLSLRVADGVETVDVEDAFRDPDGDALTYGASSSDGSVATAVATGGRSTVTVVPLSAGTVTVTVTATDRSGSNTAATQTFRVTVANRSPEAVGRLDAVSLRVADGEKTVRVSGAFRDPDGDDLTYGARSSDDSVATASATGSTVTVTPLSGGTATVTVTATDVDGSNTAATQTFRVTVANRSPEAVGRLDAVSLRVADGATPVEVSGAFRDPDGDTLTYDASSSDDSVATATASGSTVTVVPVSGGTATVTVTATDADGSHTAATQTFRVTVANRSPEAVGRLDAVSLRVADGEKTVRVSGAFRDPDGDDLTYGARSSNDSVAMASATGSTVTVMPLSAGTATVTVTATDAAGSNTAATQTFRVTVANRSPEAVGTLDAVSLRVADGVETVEVEDAFRDPDGDALRYGASSSDGSVATAVASGGRSTVTVRPLSGGTATVTVTATDVDGSNTAATQTFRVTVANRSPEAVGSLPALRRRVADGVETVQVSGAFRDPDGDDLRYGASSSDDSVARARTSGSTVRVTPVSDGTATVTVTATDPSGSNTSAEQTFAVTVPPNAGPETVGTLENKALRVTDAPLPVNVSGAFRDPDGDDLRYGASSSNDSVATASASDSTVTVTPVVRGTATVTVTATDVAGSNTTATQTFVVTVAGNRSPEAVGTLRALSLRVAAGDESVKVSGAFRDLDNDDLTYGASSSNDLVARASAPDSTVTVTPVAGGTATVTVTATDVAGSNTTAMQTFRVRVANQSPEPVGTLSPLSLRVEDGAETVRVAFAFRDPDDDDLTYGASSSAGLVATAEAAGSEVTVTPVSGGTAVVTVTARDVAGTNTTATQSFEATVANRAPVSVGRLPALLLRVSAGVRSVNVSGAFDDPDRDVLGYEASSSDDLVATAEATGSAVRVTPLSSGTATVTVAAEDGGGLQAEQAFEVTVANRSPERVGTLPALSLAVAAGAVPVEVSGAFRDPDDDVLTYDVSSSAVTVAAAEVSGSTVTVTPLSQGSATVTVTATDIDGSNTAATQAFGASVDSGGGGGGGGSRNRGPEALGTLDDRVLQVGEALPVDLSAAFRDRDEDLLTYGAGSSAEDVTTVSVAGSVATVTAVSVGESVVTLTATDADGSNRRAEQAFMVTVAYDPDGDGLIGIHTLAQLDAVRHDLDGDGVPTAGGAAGYAAAFRATDARTVPCAAAGGCRGYELGSDLDFDTNGSGGPDAGDAYWYGGTGWLPLGTATAPFTATFEGNGHRIESLFARRGDGVGLLGATGSSGVVRHVGMIAVDVSGRNTVGGLVGQNGGTVTGGYATGRVSGAEAVGGLVGSSSGVIGGSYAAVEVVGGTSAGGLVGVNAGRVAAAYATDRVSGAHRVGGLVGYNRGALTAGYATGPVSGAAEAGGLVGATEPPGTVTDSYWDTGTAGRPGPTSSHSGRAGRGVSTSAVQAPTDYAGLYAAWDVDVDGDGSADDPWHFGTDAQYPALSLDLDGDGSASWQEVGRQLRAGPVVTAAPAVDSVQVMLTWTVADAGAVTPAPAVAYTVYRAAGEAVETVASGVRSLRYADLGVEPGGAYRYQVAAAVDGGEAARSALVPSEVPCAYTVTPLHRDVLWRAGPGEVTVTTGSTCGWTAASESGFLAVTAGASGTGSGGVTYAVAANAGGPRTGALLVAGQRVRVFQASPTVFTDHPIERGVTPVKAIHFLELRARIDTLRAGVGLPGFGWTDAALIPGVTPVKGVHLTELRAALSEVQTAAGRPAPAYTDAAITTGATAIKAAHLMELRAAILTLEGRRLT